MIKYPRTPHLPWSNFSSDDTVIQHLQDVEVVVTEKLDGENTTMYCDYTHARSLSSGNHPSRTWVKNFWAGIRHQIPPGWRICGENVYAKHSIPYHDLRSYFYGFSVWDSSNTSLNWDSTQELLHSINIPTPATLYRGPFDPKALQALAKSLDTSTKEGYVVRPTREFHYSEFNHVVAKWVRPNHVQTNKHWSTQPVIPNKLQTLPQPQEKNTH